MTLKKLILRFFPFSLWIAILLLSVHLSAQTFFSDNFESGNTGWTAAGSTYNIWALGNPSGSGISAHTGSNCWATVLGGNYGVDNASEFLISPSITIGSASTVTLSFWHYYSAENMFDGGNVKISQDNGVTYAILGNYPVQSVSGLKGGDNPATYGQPGFSGNSSGWKKAQFNLNLYAGKTIRLKFQFGTDSSINSFLGWYIDDVIIDTTPVVGPVNYVTHTVIYETNGDSKVTAGDSVAVRMQVKNNGTNTVSAGTANLSISDSYVMVLDGSSASVSMSAGSSQWISDTFLFYVSADCPHNHIMNFKLETTDSYGNSWTDGINITASNINAIGPLTINTVTLFDDANYPKTGNNNGALNPGEIVEMEIVLRNLGATAYSVTGTLSSSDTYVTILENVAQYGNIYDMNTGYPYNKFRLYLSKYSPAGRNLQFVLSLTAADGSWNANFTFSVVGPALEAFQISGIVYKENGTDTNPNIVVYAYTNKTVYRGTANTTFISKSDTVNSQGEYVIPGLISGRYDIYAVRNYPEYHVFIASKLNIDVNADTVADLVEKSGKGNIAGKVLEKGTANAVVNAGLTVYDETTSSMSAVFHYTPASGIYAMSGIPAGQYCVLGYANVHYDNYVRNAAIAVNDTLANVYIELESAIEIESVEFSQSSVSRNQLQEWYVYVNVVNNCAEEIVIISPQAEDMTFKSGSSAVTDFVVEPPSYFTDSKTLKIGKGGRDSLKFKVTKTGSVLGAVAVNAKITGQGYYTYAYGYYNTEISGNYNSIIVEEQNPLRIVKITPSVRTLFYNNIIENFSIKVLVSNTTGEDIIINKLSSENIDIKIDGKRQEGFEIICPGSFDGRLDLRLPANTNGNLSFVAKINEINMGVAVLDCDISADNGSDDTSKDGIGREQIEIVMDNALRCSVKSEDGTTYVYIPENTYNKYCIVKISNVDYSNSKVKNADGKMSAYRGVDELKSTIREITVSDTGGRRVEMNQGSSATLKIYYPNFSKEKFSVDDLYIAKLNESKEEWELLSESKIYPQMSYVWTQTNSFSIFRILANPPSGDMSNVAVFPIPFYPLRDAKIIIDYLPPDKNLKISIYNISGERVRVLDEFGSELSGADAKRYTAYWDGKNDYGKEVSSGVFFMLITSADKTRVFKVVLIR